LISQALSLLEINGAKLRLLNKKNNKTALLTCFLTLDKKQTLINQHFRNKIKIKKILLFNKKQAILLAYDQILL